ncbi:MAG: chaperonin GroEL [Candidatus Nomurabacteria bacterium]|jgi:chaperonin GroEL|nr:chaperonin GroEL [Candidatus Nomurabacteria bacterium]
MSKKIFYDEDARSRILGGAKALYDAVKVTYGPKGRNVVIEKSYGGPTITHDGVTVAEAIELANDDEATLGYKIGADLIKNAATKLNKVAGDGTTTVTVLTYSILAEANKLIAAGHNPMEIRKGIEGAGAEIVEALAAMAEDISSDNKRVAEVATISAGDAEIGELIAGVISKIGKDGIVTVEAGQGLKMESEVVEGFSFDKGYVSSFFATDMTRQEAIYEKPAILITDKKVSSVAELLPLLEKMAQAGKKDLVLIADEVEGEALSVLVLNKLKGVFNTLALKAPAFGDRRKEILEDIAILTGATVVSGDRGLKLEEVGLEALGSAHKVIATKDETTIIKGAGSSVDVDTRIAQIKTQASAATSEYEKEQFEKRAAALLGKVAVIKVGGTTETEIDEKKFRVDDAVAAVKAALAEGVIAGGGVSLVNAADEMGEYPVGCKCSDDKCDGCGCCNAAVMAGRKVLRTALLAPFVQIMENAGLASSVLLAKVRENKGGFGVNVMNVEAGVVDLKKVGVVDPVKVAKEAVANAVSIAATAITMGAIVVDVPSTSENVAPAMGGGMGMY